MNPPMPLADLGPETAVIAVPSKGRLREDCLSLLSSAGYATGMLHGGGSLAKADRMAFIEMRPRDAAAAFAADQLDAAFLATDIVMEHGLEDIPSIPLGFSRSTLVLASRDDDGRAVPDDLAGGVVATHLPQLTERYFADLDVGVTVVPMGGSLEGVCAAGLADAIVDLRETGTSLASNRLRVLTEIAECQALFLRRPGVGVLDDVQLRLESVLAAQAQRYVMLHISAERMSDLQDLFPGLASPTVLPLAGREDLVAVHLVVDANQFWDRLSDLRAMGATGIVALEPQALLF